MQHTIRRKRVQEFINRHGAISVRKTTIDRMLKQGRVTQIRMTDTETKHSFTTDLRKFVECGEIRDVGYGLQYFLPIEYFAWKCPSKAAKGIGELVHGSLREPTQDPILKFFSKRIERINSIKPSF